MDCLSKIINNYSFEHFGIPIRSLKPTVNSVLHQIYINTILVDKHLYQKIVALNRLLYGMYSFEQLGKALDKSL